MLKELKYLFFVLVIFLFFFQILNYYFSDTNKKKSYRSLKKNDEIIFNFSQKLILLENDTDNTLEYVKKATKKKKK